MEFDIKKMGTSKKQTNIFEKVATCQSPTGTTYGYIYTKNGWFGYYSVVTNIREKKVPWKKLENMSVEEWI